MNERILISGASIAGLTLAHWLARYGFRPTVVERSGALRAGGNGVDVRDQAAAVADRMGLTPALRAAATDVRGMKFVDAADRCLARIDTAVPGAVEILRGDLVTLLAAGVDVGFGDSIRTLTQHEDGVTVTFANRDPARYDLVIGADGLHSTTRRLAFGGSGFVRFRGHYFAFADTDAALAEDRWVTMYNTPGRMAGVWRSGNHSQAKAYFVFRSPERPDVDQHRRLIREAFAADRSWRIPQLLTASLADPELYFDALSQVRMPSWSTGRVALVGDAAWCASPASGAGAELALVGAYRLAGELAAAGGDHRIAFPRYEAAHRGLVRRKQRITTNVRLMVPRTATGARLRNAVARLPLMRTMAAMDSRRVPPLTDYAPALP